MSYLNEILAGHGGVAAGTEPGGQMCTRPAGVHGELQASLVYMVSYRPAWWAR